MTTLTIDAGTAAHRPVQPAHTARTASADDAQTTRVAWLFRHSLRSGEVHPALHLIQRHRSVQGALEVPLPAPPKPAALGAQAAIDAASLDRSIGELPALPQVVLELMTLLDDDGVNFADLATRIERDQALVACTLRLANSPFYGVPGRVGSIRNAIQVLGQGTVGTLLTTASLSTRFSGIVCAGFDFPGFWKHALGTGIAARALARAVRLDGDLAFAAGLLHDIGRLVLAARFPNQLADAIRCGHDSDSPELDAERGAMACDHTEVGTRVAGHWHFPAAVVDAIRHHHHPGDGHSAAPSVTDVIHVADALAHGLDLLCSPHECVPAVVPAAWSRLAISDDQFMSVLEQTEQGVTALCQALSL